MVSISSTTTSAPAALGLRQPLLLADYGVDQVEQRGPDQRGHVAADRPLGGGDDQDAAVEDGPPEVDRRARLAQDRPRPPRGGVVRQPGLDRSQRFGLVLGAPAAEIARPPFKQVGVAHFFQHIAPERFVGEQPQGVEDRALLVFLG